MIIIPINKWGPTFIVEFWSVENIEACWVFDSIGDNIVTIGMWRSICFIVDQEKCSLHVHVEDGVNDASVTHFTLDNYSLDRGLNLNLTLF